MVGLLRLLRGGTRGHNEPKDFTYPNDAQEGIPRFERSSDEVETVQQIIRATRSSRQVMRQVSGLGMVDPVYGADNVHSPLHSSKFLDGMDFAAIPEDMREELSCCSDHTANEADGIDVDLFLSNLDETGSRNGGLKAWQMNVMRLSSRNFSKPRRHRELPMCPQDVIGERRWDAGVVQIPLEMSPASAQSRKTCGTQSRATQVNKLGESPQSIPSFVKKPISSPLPLVPLVEDEDFPSKAEPTAKHQKSDIVNAQLNREMHPDATRKSRHCSPSRGRRENLSIAPDAPKSPAGRRGKSPRKSSATDRRAESERILPTKRLANVCIRHTLSEPVLVQDGMSVSFAKGTKSVTQKSLGERPPRKHLACSPSNNPNSPSGSKRLYKHSSRSSPKSAAERKHAGPPGGCDMDPPKSPAAARRRSPSSPPSPRRRVASSRTLGCDIESQKSSTVVRRRSPSSPPSLTRRVTQLPANNADSRSQPEGLYRGISSCPCPDDIISKRKHSTAGPPGGCDMDPPKSPTAARRSSPSSPPSPRRRVASSRTLGCDIESQKSSTVVRRRSPSSPPSLTRVTQLPANNAESRSQPEGFYKGISSCPCTDDIISKRKHSTAGPLGGCDMESPKSPTATRRSSPSSPRSPRRRVVSSRTLQPKESPRRSIRPSSSVPTTLGQAEVIGREMKRSADRHCCRGASDEQVYRKPGNWLDKKEAYSDRQPNASDVRRQTQVSGQISDSQRSSRGRSSSPTKRPSQKSQKKLGDRPRSLSPRKLSKQLK